MIVRARIIWMTLGVALLIALASPVRSQQDKSAAAPLTSDATDLVLILDCSSSMLAKTREGPTRMDAAKQVVTELLQDFPTGRRLGLVVYGHDKQRGCQAVDVVRLLTPLDDAGRAELKQYVARLQPVGHAPLGRALQLTTGAVVLATDAVAKPKGLARVVLITNGMETCHGDPVKAVAALAEKARADVDVIGFGLQPEESKTVDRIARAGRGKYYDAQTVEKLRKDLRQVTQVAAITVPAEKPTVVAVPANKPSVVVAFRPEQLPNELASFLGHTGPVDSVAFSPDGRRVLSVSEEDRTVRQWDLIAKKELDTARMEIYG